MTPDSTSSEMTMTESSLLTRDLTLSSEAPMAFCLRLLLQELRWTGQSRDFVSLFGRDPRSMDLVDARNILLRLGHNSKLVSLVSWERVRPSELPALYVSTDDQPYVITLSPSEHLVATNAHGRFDPDELPEPGWLLVLDDAGVSERASVLQTLLHRFSTKIRSLYLISAALAVLSLALPFYIRAIYNIAIPGRSFASVFWLLVGGVFVFTLDLNLRKWRVSLLSRLAGRLDVMFGLKLLQKFLHLDYRQLEVLGLSGFSSRSRNLDSMLAYAQGPLALALLDFPFIFLFLFAIYLISGPLVFVPLAVMVIGGVLVLFLSRYYSSAQEMNITTGIGLFQAQQELVRRFRQIRLSNLEWVWFQRLRGLSGQSTTSGLVINEQIGRLQIISTTASQLAGVLTLGVGVWFAFQSSDPKAMGNLIAAMFLVWRIFTPFQYLMSALLRFDSVKRQFGQVDQFLRLKSNERPDATTQLQAPKMAGYIELNSASCRLGSDSALQLTRVSLHVSPGEILALTGNSGSGKSVVLRVIDQLYPISSGSLLLDGKDHRQLSAEAIRSNVAYVLSTPQFLPGSIWQNLTAMNSDARFQDVAMVCQMLELHQFFESLPDGYHTTLTEDIIYGIPLGVRRLFSLAQALIKDSPILLIDDLSQGLTPTQFDLVVNLLPSLRRSCFRQQKRSVIVSTENKALLSLADRICILDKGVTAFEGTPEELQRKVQQSSPKPGASSG